MSWATLDVGAVGTGDQPQATLVLVLGFEALQLQACGVDREVMSLKVAGIGVLKALQLVDPVLLGGPVQRIPGQIQGRLAQRDKLDAGGIGTFWNRGKESCAGCWKIESIV